MQIDRRIQYLERFLSRAEIINVDTKLKVFLGSRVSVLNENGEHKSFIVVESHEADITKQKISSHSPLGRGLLHKQVNEIVEIVTQKGKKQYKIVEIS